MPFYTVDYSPSNIWQHELLVALEQLRDDEIEFIEGVRKLVSLANQPTTSPPSPCPARSSSPPAPR